MCSIEHRLRHMHQESSHLAIKKFHFEVHNLLYQMENEQNAIHAELSSALAGFDKEKLKPVTTNEKNSLPTKETIEQEKSSSQ